MHLVQLPINITKAVRHLQAFLRPSALEDDSLVLKTALTEALDGPVVRPWAVHARRGATLTIVGYSDLAAEQVNERRALALPSVQAAIGEALSVEMPPLKPGSRFQYSVRFVPTIRVTPTGNKRHGERDAFLVAADEAGPDGKLTRDLVYRDYLENKLSGASIETCRLESFRLARLVRPKVEGHGNKTMPEAVLGGVLEITDPETFSAVLRAGVGRQRAYGYGMIRLQPASQLAMKIS